MSAKPTRTTMAFRVAELAKLYTPHKIGKVWRLRNRENGELSVPEYTEEHLAIAGAALLSAMSIVQYCEANL